MAKFDFHPALFAVAPATSGAKSRAAPIARRAPVACDPPARVPLKALACQMDRPDVLEALVRCGLINHAGHPTPWAVAEGLGELGKDRNRRPLALWDAQRTPGVLALVDDFHLLSRFQHRHDLVAKVVVALGRVRAAMPLHGAVWAWADAPCQISVSEVDAADNGRAVFAIFDPLDSLAKRASEAMGHAPQALLLKRVLACARAWLVADVGRVPSAPHKGVAP